MRGPISRACGPARQLQQPYPRFGMARRPVGATPPWHVLRSRRVALWLSAALGTQPSDQAKLRQRYLSNAGRAVTLFLTIAAGVFVGLCLYRARWLMVALVWILLLVLAANA